MEGVVLDTAASWHVEHLHFERLLAFLERRLGVPHVGELPNYDLMRDITNYICHFGARYHHAREDIAFGYIVQSNPAMSGTISRLVREHANMAAKGEELDELLARAVAGDASARARIVDVLPAFLTAYRNHITAEEQDILPYATANLSTANWESVAGAAPPGPEPFQKYGAGRHSPTFGSEAELRYRALCDRMRTERSAQPGAGAVHRTVDGWIHDSGERKSVAGFLAVPRPRTLRPRTATARRHLVRQTIALSALVLACLQYYFLDVHLQIAHLPSIFPGLVS